MDKQFVNIDELMRQRLGDGEETERAGAWANMRNVLDREMPQKKRRGGFFFWFNGLALIMLIGAISFGGYELTSFIEHSNAKTFAASTYPTTGVTASTVGDNSTSRHMHSGARVTAHGYSSADVREPNTANSTTNTTGAISITGTTNETEENENTNVNTTNTTTGTANTNTNTNTNIAAVTTRASNNNQNKSNNDITTTPSSRAIAITGRMASSNTASSQKNNIATTKTPAASNRRTDVAATTPSAKGATIALGAKENDNTRTGATPAAPATRINKLATTTTNRAIAGNAPSANNGSKELVWNSGSTPSKTIGGARNNVSTSRGATPSAERTATAGANATADNNNTKAKSKLKQTYSDPCNGVTHSITDAVVKKALKTHKQQSANTVSATGNDATVVARKTRAAKTQPATAGITRAKQTTGIAKTVAANKIPVAANTTTPKTVALPKDQLTADNSAEKKKEEEKKDRRHGITLVLHERLLKNADNETYKKFDTISLKKWEEETSRMMASNTSNNSSGSSHSTHGKSGNKQSPNSSTRNAGTNANGATSSANSQEAEAEGEATPVLAAATTPAETPAAPAVKENSEVVKPTASKKSNEPSTMEKLTETFNDIKYHVKGMQFAPGITGGINSTFFGPNSLKGFQFGVTGEFIFSDRLSVKSELKYFHRINNNFAVQDEYAEYTAVGGVWRKDVYTQSYAFSTLHSLELPVSVRYTSGKFSFFAGGNAVYSFNVNTGLAGPATLSNSTIVTAAGTDDARKIHDGDFNSRIGVGYLFGMSFQAAPNFTIDIRNVQTVWDNAPTSGSKYVSGQLFRSPSVQVGIGYRFSGKTED
jgi:hypothetical protein